MARRPTITGVCIAAIIALSYGCAQLPDSTLPTFIPGPSAPDVQTAVPLTWDSQAELVAWASNAASRGSISIEESGSAAFIRVLTGAYLPNIPATNYTGLKAVLRGPDLNPSRSITGLRIRFRWVYFPTNGQKPCNCWNPDFVFQIDRTPGDSPSLSWDGGGRVEARLAGTPGATDWREAFFPNLTHPSEAVRYLYVAFQTNNNSGPVMEWPGQFDIDWLKIEHH